MQPCLCKKHLRQVSNMFDKETAYMYALSEKTCVICNQVIFIEGARRYITGTRHNSSEQALRDPNSHTHKSA